MSLGTYIYFSALYLPHLGGVERYTYNLSKKLVEFGNKVIIVTSALGDDEGISVDQGIEIIRVPSILLLGGRFPIVKKNTAFKKIWNILHEASADYVLVNTRYYMLSLLGLNFARNKNLPAIVIDHSSDYLSVGNEILDRVIHLYENVITTKVKKYQPAFFSVSSRGVEWLRHFNISASGVLHNAVDLELYQNAAKDFNMRITEKSKASFKVVYVGRLVPEKGVLKLCEAVQSLVDNGNKGICLEIAGSGPVEDEVKKRCNNNIIFLGRLDAKDVAKVLREGDVFCLPTVYPEGFPTVLLEAGASKMGIIVTDTGGARELIPDEGYGIVLSDNSVKSISEAIMRFYSDFSYLSQVSSRLEIRVAENFTWEKTALVLTEFCESETNKQI